MNHFNFPAYYNSEPLNNLWKNLKEKIEVLEYPLWSTYESEIIEEKCLILFWGIACAYDQLVHAVHAYDQPVHEECFEIRLQPDGRILWKWSRDQISIGPTEPVHELSEEGIKYLSKVNDLLIVQDIIE